MSVKWISYIWDKTDYKEGDLLTALALADFANDEGECFPFMKTIAQKARLSVRQIQKIIKNFEADGFLSVKRSQGRGKKPSFTLKKVNSATPFADRKKVNSGTIKGELCDIKKVNSATLPIYKDEPSLEPLENRENADAKTAPPQDKKSQGRPPEPNNTHYRPDFNSEPNALAAATECAMGINLSIPLQQRIGEVVPPPLKTEWLELVKNRMADKKGKPRNWLENRLGYWLGDFQRDYKFQLNNLKNQTFTPSVTVDDIDRMERETLERIGLKA